MKILGIDDSGNIDYWIKCFHSDDYEYTSICDGRECIRFIRDGKYDLVLMDLAQPGYTNKDAVISLEKVNLLKKQPTIVFVESSTSEDEIDDFIVRGAYQCIRKPVKIELLVSVLKGLTKVKPIQTKILKKWPLTEQEIKSK